MWVSTLFLPTCLCALYVHVFWDQQESHCWYRPGAFQTQLLILLLHLISHRCAFVRRSPAQWDHSFHLYNLQTSSICRASAVHLCRDPWIHKLPDCLSWAPVWPPDVCHRYIYLPLNRGCLIALSTKTTVQSPPLIAGFFCSARLNHPHRPRFLFAWYEMFPNIVGRKKGVS